MVNTSPFARSLARPRLSSLALLAPLAACGAGTEPEAPPAAALSANGAAEDTAEPLCGNAQLAPLSAPEGTRRPALGDAEDGSASGAPTANRSAAPPGAVEAAEFLETFDDQAWLDPSAETPPLAAHWNTAAAPGLLQANADFPGTGGPGGNFDWVIPAGTTVILNTDADTILGGPGGVPTTTQSITMGLVQVRDFTVGAGASLFIVGSHPCTIVATGEVEIRGRVSADGADNPGVGTLNTTNLPEPGAPGRAGGGDGGVGSWRVNASTERGGPGEAAFGVPALGGEGGESGYALGGSCAKEFRRGAGGGGGVFGPDVRYPWNGALVRCQMLVGMDAERGILGSLEGTGAVSQAAPAAGGAKAPSPFVDGDDTNDFYGLVTLPDGRQVRGELPSLWAGSGGGAGGDASRTATFPRVPFDPLGDEKGAGGGGGGGGLMLLARGDIRILGTGSISADGGTGGGGENTIYFDRVGGGSGGGSGGHIVLSSAGRVVLESEATGSTVGSFYGDALDVAAHEKRPLRALGGQGGAGRESRCGANEDGERTWAQDSIPVENFEGDPTIPPQSVLTANGLLNWARLCTLNNHAVCADEGTPGETFGAGGDGGPGVIQVHVPDPMTDIVLGAQGAASGGYGTGGDVTFAMVPPPLGWTGPNAPVASAEPFFSGRSVAETRWIPLAPYTGATGTPARFLFHGTDPMTGAVLRVGNEARELPPLVPYTEFGTGSTAPSVVATSGAFVFYGASAIDPLGLYRENAMLMREFAVRVREASSATGETEFTVQHARYDAAGDLFVVTVDPRGLELSQLLDDLDTPAVALVPYFVRLRTAGVLDAYPAGTEVAVLFDAAKVDPATGLPSTDPNQILSGGDASAYTPRAGDLNGDVWDFVRLRFEFHMDVSDPSAPRPALDFVRLPFRY